MQKIFSRLTLVVLVLGIMGLAIYPPEKNLRRGKDLAGGVTLTYSVNVGSDRPEELLSRMIEVLKERVDPANQLDITMIAQGRDRIEITMPLPSPRVQGLRRAYDEELAKLGAEEFTGAELERVLRLEGQGRQDAAGKLVGESSERRVLLDAAIVTADEQAATLEAYRAAERVLEEARGAGAEQEQLDELEGLYNDAVNAAGAAGSAYDEARDVVLGSVLPVEEVRRALLRSNVPIAKIDQRTGEAVQLASARERSLTRLRGDHPAAVAQLERIVEVYNAYEAERTTLDDPSDLMRLLRGAGVLDFRITVKPGDHAEEQRLRSELHERGPRNVETTDARWHKINKIDTWYDDLQQLERLMENPAGFFNGRGYVVEEYDGEYFMLCWDIRGSRLTKAEGDWDVSNAYQTADELGKPAIGFNMNARGATLLGNLTEAHVGNNMAVLLDDQVFTAPVLQSRISQSGRISGDFTDAEISYITRVLGAGSLQAKLSPDPISVNTIAPTLGADNLAAGLRAGVWALGIVSLFMVVYYFNCGAIAVFTLFCNALLILGAMSLNRAAFTMPGIAAVILTFGMAVDANVLIYERIREELRLGTDLRTSVRLGYQRALSSIIDGNVTNLIVCLVLAAPGISTQEIKGFAITLGIGVVATLFSTLFVSRLIFDIFIEIAGWKRLSMLPLAVPAIERLLHPKINWLRLRWVFIAISVGYVSLGLGMIAFRNVEMLDTEFRGGIEIEFVLRRDVDGEHMTLTRQEAQDRVVSLGNDAETGSPLQFLRNAEIVPVNPRRDNITSDHFKIKVIAADEHSHPIIYDAIVRQFQDVLDTQPSLRFTSQDETEIKAAPVYVIMRGTLGEDIDRPQYRNDVNEYQGAVVIVLEDLDPPPSLEELESRLEHMRSQPDYSDTLARKREVIILEGDEAAVVSAAVVSLDSGLSVFTDEERWWIDVAGREWRLVQDGLTRSTTLASMRSFSATIAKTFLARAIVAFLLSFLLISIYIWVRFGSVRYSLAALIALIHDVLVAVGLIALAEIVYSNPTTQGFAESLGIKPFKIDLNLVAALLTIIGYSLNDTIIIMDRIRENRGKLSYATAETVNKSINQTISRTVITSGTTLLAVLILYIFGGEGVRSFSFTLMVGILVGTYSSVAVAAPLVWSHKHDKSALAEEDADEAAGEIVS